MPLPSDFSVFIAPQGLPRGAKWSGIVLQRRTAYQRRFFVHGLRQAAEALGFFSATALWRSLDRPPGPAATSPNDPNQGRSAIKAITAAIPLQWTRDLPDINDKGDAEAHTTYWRHFSESQLLLAFEPWAQSLPKALLSVAAL